MNKTEQLILHKFLVFLDLHSDLSTETIQRLRDQRDRFIRLTPAELELLRNS